MCGRERQEGVWVLAEFNVGKWIDSVLKVIFKKDKA